MQDEKQLLTGDVFGRTVLRMKCNRTNAKKFIWSDSLPLHDLEHFLKGFNKFFLMTVLVDTVRERFAFIQ
jgi:hypothetical protein